MGNNFFVYVLIACTGLCVVHSASFFIRTGREIAVDPLDSEIVNEVVSELRKEPLQVLADIDVPLVKGLAENEPEPAIVAIVEPVPVALVADNAPIADEPSVKNILNAEDSLRNAASDMQIVAVKEVMIPVHIDLPKEIPAKLEDVVATKTVEVRDTVPDAVASVSVHVKDAAAEIAPVESSAAAHRNDPEIKEEQVLPLKAVPENSEKTEASDSESDEEIRQNEVDGTTVRPNLLQQAQQTINQLINNNPISNAINNIRQPAQTTQPPVVNLIQDPEVPIVEAADPVPSTSRPNLLQQIQTGVQSIQNQIQSVFNPNTGTVENQIGVTNRPGILQQIQTVVGQPIQGLVSGIQTNLQNAQNQISGIFRPQASNTAAPANDPPVTPAATGALVTEPAAQANDDIPIVHHNIETVDNKVESPAATPIAASFPVVADAPANVAPQTTAQRESPPAPAAVSPLVSVI